MDSNLDMFLLMVYGWIQLVNILGVSILWWNAAVEIGWFGLKSSVEIWHDTDSNMSLWFFTETCLQQFIYYFFVGTAFLHLAKIDQFPY